MIPGNATFVNVPVDAIDDALLDGDVSVRITATAATLAADDVDLIVSDRESLAAVFSVAQIREDAPNSANLIVSRSNTDTDQPLVVAVTGGNPSDIGVPASVTIPAGQQQISLPLVPLNDDAAELARTLAFTFTAAGYQSASAEIELLDDEPPLFQNPVSRYDVNNDGEVLASDAIRVINQLALRGESDTLDPSGEQPDGIFLDVNGDYRVSAIDALMIINELSRIQDAISNEGEVVLLPIAMPVESVNEDDDRDDLWVMQVGLLG